MGAMQAQDYSMVKWAVGVRLPNSTDRTIESAINNGEIIRTHLLRPTWHLVSAEDIHWILELTAPQIKATLKSRHKELGISEAIVTKSNAVIKQALSDGIHLTRNELVTELEKHKIMTNENRASHLLLRAELDGIVCSGATKGKNQTYTLLEVRVPKTKPLSREKALANLARQYFSSHCPATIYDFVWWSGLSTSDAKQALEMVKSDFVSETIDSHAYWFTNILSSPKPEKEDVHLLPAFDEFIISYKDRSASLPFENHNKTVSNNGIFRPVIVVNGQIVGIWKRSIKKDKVIVEAEFFKQPSKSTMLQIEKATVQYGCFLEKEPELTYKF
ncbi:MAG: AlkZ family DNA glycosylase [Chloroflexi bacterium]|nr:AlkZ family DNA glycosylase [Chloroflexota bacterium]